LALRAVRLKREALLRDLDDLFAILAAPDAGDSDMVSRLSPIREEILAIFVTDEMSIEELSSANSHLSALGAEIQKLLPD